MKKLVFVMVALLGISATQAQIKINYDSIRSLYESAAKASVTNAELATQTAPVSFLDENGLMRPGAQEQIATANAQLSVFHRLDDVVWSCEVYRIIDMRFKQNYPLYTPLSADDPVNSSLLKTMLMAIGNGMPVFSKSETGDIRPTFNLANMQIGPDALSLLDAERAGNYDPDDEENRAFQRVLKPDSITENLVVNASSFPGYAKNQLKYLIKEVIFFDKHYCRLYSEIEAIAPLHAENGDMELDDMTAVESIYSQILFWVRYNDFRPYMTQKYVSPRDNDSKRVTFDDFFRLKLYSSYILGINNVYGRMVPEIAQTYEEIQREQKKIEVDLLNIEQDLWEY